MAHWKPPSIIVWWMAILGLSIVCVQWFNDWELLGFSNAEVYGHVWSQSWRLNDLPESLMGTDLTVGTESFPLIDPIPTILTSIWSTFLGLNGAYNLLFIASILACAWSGSQLAELEQGHILTGSLVLSTSPIIWGLFNSGLTEDWGVVLTIGSMIALYKSRVVISGLLLGATAYWGLVLGWMSAIFLSLVCIVIRKDVRSLVKILGVALVSVVPLMILHSERLMLEGHRTGGTLPAQIDPLWMLNPWHQTDLASLLWMGSTHFSDGIIRLHPAYLGWVALVLAIRSQAWRWWLLFTVFLGFALGPNIYWTGESTGVVNPFSAVLSWLPGGGLLNHQGRWMLMALLCWVVLVSKGVQKKWGTYLLPCLVVEFLWLSPLGFPFMGTPKIKDSTTLMSLQQFELPNETRVLRIPVRGPGVVFQKALYEQTVHQHPLWLNPNRPNPSEWLQIQSRSVWIERIAIDQTMPLDACVPSSVGALLVSEPYISLVSKYFSSPEYQDRQYAVWTRIPRCN